MSTPSTTASNRVPFFATYAFEGKRENSLTRVNAYFNLSQQATKVSVDAANPYRLNITNETQRVSRSVPMVALKVISYCTVIIPLIMLIIYAIVRSRYTIIPQSSPAPVMPTPAAPSVYASITTPVSVQSSTFNALQRPQLLNLPQSQHSVSAPSAPLIGQVNTHEEFLDAHGINKNNQIRNLFEEKRGDFEEYIKSTGENVYSTQEIMKCYDILLKACSERLSVFTQWTLLTPPEKNRFFTLGSRSSLMTDDENKFDCYFAQPKYLQKIKDFGLIFYFEIGTHSSTRKINSVYIEF